MSILGRSPGVSRAGIVFRLGAFGLVLALAAPSACSASSSNAFPDDGAGGAQAATGSGGAGGTGTFASTGGGGDQGSSIATTGSGSDSSGSVQPCAGVSAEAQASLQPADVIIAVDTSGSMDEESGEVQANLNAFASVVTGSGIDMHVVLIADASVCIPAPLGSGNCGGADENLPSFRHVVQAVGSNDSLELLVSTYPQYKDSLRQGATKTFIVVSDDNSDMSAAEFTNAIMALDPSFAGFKFDAIVSYTSPLSCFGFSCPPNNPCCVPFGPIGCQPLSAEEGTVYKQLVAQTGGVSGDLCAQDFDPVFQDIAKGVVGSSKLACEYPIPDPPEGEEIDPNKVNVTYTPGGGGEPQPIYNVPGGAAQCGPEGGWYYDDLAMPTKIVLCPATCQTIQADSMGKFEVVFGCDTQVIPK